jgi:hypothetical protein
MTIPSKEALKILEKPTKMALFGNQENKNT